jgi:hypothetical protein
VARRIAIIFSCGLLIAACGSSGKPAASKDTADSQGITFSKCMRSHGVSNFPDPGSGGGIQITSSSGFNPASPAFQSAQNACAKLLPGGGPGSGPPNPQAKARMLKISECMRAHGISGFPDPQNGSPPSNPAGYSGIMATNGYYLAIPSSINTRSPAFEQAAAACNFGPRGGAARPKAL